VVPDIQVKNLPSDLMLGVDAQLDRSIEWVVRRLADQKDKTVPPIP
jgi:hypothetical protein